MKSISLGHGLLVLTLVLGLQSMKAAERVQLRRVPNGGLQPQAMMDAQGTLHLLYYKGDPKGGDIFYVRQAAGASEYSQPLRVNSQPGTAISMGTIRGAHLALGKGGRVEVAWNGNKAVEGASHAGSPMWFTRLNDAGSAFEPQRDLIHDTGALDGGGTLAADAAGNVYVLWHGMGAGAKDESQRAVYLARSTDEGKTFARETRVNPRDTGACGCCGMRAFADAAGNLFAIYRAAGEKVNRDETLIVSRDQGKSFQVVNEDRWKAATCPMSSAAITSSQGGIVAAWETAEQVCFVSLDDKTLQPSRPTSPSGVGSRKHPSVAVASNGDVLLAWAEGTGWQKGGSLAWQIFDANGNPKAEKGRVPGVPIWSLPSTVARADGSFVIFY